MTGKGGHPARISVVVASRGRPALLGRCLQAIDQLVWPAFEVVVVADAAGRAAMAGRGDSGAGLTLVAADAPGLSAARNLGIAEAGGDILAFIDDDAVPEPMWLAAIAEGFRDGAVGAVTGPVLGRNGISRQSGAETILADATSVPAATDPAFRRARPGRAPKTVGTNMAFRADLLRAAGGFDETFAFYLDEADLDMRLGAAGAVTAYAPLAVVHHATAASERRRADRAPRDLTDIGHSTAAFLIRHHDPLLVDDALGAARSREWARAVAALQSGRIEPRDLGRLMAGFDAGAAAGREAGTPRLADFGPAPPFRPRQRREAHHAVVAGAFRTRKAARCEARRQRDAGATVSLFEFSFSTLYHRVRYEDGIWVQKGGVWGRSDRQEPLFRFTTRRARLSAEVARISGSRGLDTRPERRIPGVPAVSVELVPFF